MSTEKPEQPAPQPENTPTTPRPAPTTIGQPAPSPAQLGARASRGPAGPAASFGRIGDDGTVYLRTGSGERVIGSWQAGSKEEGLAHFALRFTDLVTEVDLIESRTKAGAADPGHSLGRVKQLRSDLDTAAVIGDVDALSTRLQALIGEFTAQHTEASRLKQAERDKAVTAKEKLAAEAEDLAAGATHWKSAGDRMRAILEEWKAIHGLPRKTDQQLWKRYAAARDAFNKRRGAHFASLDASRKEVAGQKEAIIAEAESLADSTDWGPTAARMKDLMARWKHAGRAPREAEEALWKRFRAAQDAFFNARSAVFAERDAEYLANQKAKEALLATAEAVDPAADPSGARAALASLQGDWDALGKVPREAMAGLDRRLRAVETKLRGAAEQQWRQANAEANPLLEQMRSQVREAEEKLEKARAAGDNSRVADAEKALSAKRQLLAMAEKG